VSRAAPFACFRDLANAAKLADVAALANVADVYLSADSTTNTNHAGRHPTLRLARRPLLRRSEATARQRAVGPSRLLGIFRSSFDFPTSLQILEPFSVLRSLRRSSSFDIRALWSKLITRDGLVHNSDQLTSGCVGLFRKTLFLYLKYCDIRG
jgi:hypothetical protein